MPEPKEPPSSVVQAGGRPSGHVEADDSDPEDQRRDAAEVDNEWPYLGTRRSPGCLGGAPHASGDERSE
jgi:hypothetical protein